MQIDKIRDYKSLNMHVPSARLFLTGLFVTFGGSFHFGYQISIVNPTQDVFWSFFNSSHFAHYGTYLSEDRLRVLWSAVTGLLFIGSLVGATLMPWMAERFGRRNSLFISSSLFILSTFPSALSHRFNAFEVFIVGRVCFGVAIGLVTGFQGLYLTEISPREYRGFMGALTGLMIQFGLVVGSVVALPTVLGTEKLWPVMYWLEIGPSTLLLVILCFSYESPSYLLAKGQEERAKQSIQIYHRGDSGKIKQFIETLQEELEMEQESTSLIGLFKTRLAWRGALLGVLVAVASNFCGVTPLGFFATYLMTQTGFSTVQASAANVAIAAGSCIASGVAPFATERIGRRPLFLFACAMLTVLNFVIFLIILCFHYTGLVAFGYVFMVTNVLFMLTFGIGMAPIIWYLTTEMVPQNCKAAAQGITTMVTYLLGFVMPVMFLPLEGKAGEYSFFLFIAPMIALTVYFYYCLPETKNRSTREVLERLYGNFYIEIPKNSDE